MFTSAKITLRAHFFLIGLRQAKFVYGDPCGIYNRFINIRYNISGFKNLPNLPVPILGDDRNSAHKDIVWASTPCGVVSTPDSTVFVPGLSDLKVYGRV